MRIANSPKTQLKQKLVKREKDLKDRRKVLIVPQREEASKKIGPFFQSLIEDMAAFYEQYSENELEVIRDFLLGTNEFFHEKTRELRNE